MIIGKLHKFEREFMNNKGSGDYHLTGTDVADIKEFMKLTIDNFVTVMWQIKSLQDEIKDLRESLMRHKTFEKEQKKED